jgi:tetratricopeptide (TPR) repeat protein
MDSTFAYYTAICAYHCEDWNMAEKYFNKSIDVKYGEANTVLLLNDVYAAMKDTAKMIANLRRGIELFPDDNGIIFTLIQIYISTGLYDDALKFLDATIEKMPNNAQLHFARGFLFENKGDIDVAEINYRKALEYNKNYYEPLISLGVIYFNKGAEQTRKANDMQKQSDYDAAMSQATEFFKQALPYVERADQAKPNDENVLDTMKNIYYRLQMMDKYEEVVNKMENLKK